MVHSIDQLPEQDREIIYNAIPQITVLIGMADGYLDSREIAYSKKATMVRSYAADPDLKSFYKTVSSDIEDRLQVLIQQLPRDAEARNKELSQRLGKVSHVLPKLRADLALKLFRSLKSFAKHIAESSGGFLSYLNMTAEEAKLVELNMIEYDSKI